MNAMETLKAAQTAGVFVGVDAGDLVLEAAAEPPRALLHLLKRHKVEIVAFLDSGPDNWSAEQWREFFDERAAIAEFDGGLVSAAAVDLVFACCVTEWRRQHPERARSRGERQSLQTISEKPGADTWAE